MRLFIFNFPFHQSVFGRTLPSPPSLLKPREDTANLPDNPKSMFVVAFKFSSFYFIVQVFYFSFFSLVYLTEAPILTYTDIAYINSK